MDDQNYTEPVDVSFVFHEIIEQRIFHFSSDILRNSSDVKTTTDNMPENCPLRFKLILHVSGLILTALICLANISVVYLFASNRTLRGVAVNYLLLSLSLIDFLSGVSLAIFLLPYFYLQVVGCKKLKDNFGMYYFIAADQLFNFLFLASIAHFLALSSERIISLFWALTYNNIVRKSRAYLACAVIWISAFFLSAIQLTWQKFSSIHSQHEINQVARYDKTFSLVTLVAFGVIPSLILAIQYGSMFVCIRRIVRRQPNGQSAQRSIRERKALVIYCTMFVFFVLFVFPYFVLRVIVEHVDWSLWERMPREVPETALTVRYVVSVVNPVLYALYKKDFRKALARSVQKFKSSPCFIRRRRPSDNHLLKDRLLGREAKTPIQRQQTHAMYARQRELHCLERTFVKENEVAGILILESERLHSHASSEID